MALPAMTHPTGNAHAILVPYHQGERLDEAVVPVTIAGECRTVGPELPGGDISRRLAVLGDAVANEVAAAVRAGGPAVVLSGDSRVGMAVLAGTQRAGVDPGVLGLDGHG